MTTVGPIREVHVEYDVETPLRDGTILRSTVYRPAVPGRFPVLLSRTPYGRDNGIDPLYFDPLRAVRRGYVVTLPLSALPDPEWDRLRLNGNLNTGRSAYDSAVTAVARQRIFHDPDRPSRITLTVVEP
jgi:predicted acyl esterase